MEKVPPHSQLPIPVGLKWGDVHLGFLEFIPAQPRKGLSPRYRFIIFDENDVHVGQITFRVGDTWHIRNAAGHIGYSVLKQYRGHGYAEQACRALVPFMRNVYDRVIITTNLVNTASMRTIEKLGGQFLEIVDIPADDPAAASGETQRRRYEWVFDEASAS